MEEGRRMDDLVEKYTKGQDPSGSQIKKSVNQIYGKKFKDLDKSSIKSCTIFKVNVWLRESNPTAYTSKMVSIGPYHNKNCQLDPMEKYKLLYLLWFLKRKEGLNMESCVSELEKRKEEALKCYDDVDTDKLKKLEKEALKCYDVFCEILLLDGCFVVKFIREYRGIRPIGEDRILNGYNETYIFQDLILLENQLPFFVLNKLHLMTKQDEELPLTILASNSLPFFVDLPKMTLESFIETGGCYNIEHLLHLVHELSCHGNHEKKTRNNNYLTGHIAMPNATELSEAGVSFVKEDKLGNKISLFDSIKFENGLMKIPCFKVEDSTEILLRNLIAYEQQSIDVQPKYFSDFAFFMDRLIESDKNVNLLHQKGIIENWIGEDQEVANLFNKIGKGVNLDHNFFYQKECVKARQHCEKPWNKMKASLIRNYFSSPWARASTMATIILPILTTIQTILAFTDSTK